VVRGDLHTYKIHLGGANVLMEPGSHYLCIVPDRGRAAWQKGPLYLPFDGDQTLAIILSKAQLLAADSKIPDATILSPNREPATARALIEIGIPTYTHQLMPLVGRNCTGKANEFHFRQACRKSRISL
jgi:hypothetical protein